MPVAFLSARLRTPGTSAALAFQLHAGLGLSPSLEHRFHPTRKWAFDLAIPEQMIAIEVEGGLFLPTSGRHNRGAGMRADLEKYAEAVILGWRLIRVLPEWIPNGRAFTLIERLVKQSAPP